MKTPAEWLAEQVGDRPGDFAPEEMAMPLSWIASVQADARKDLERVVRIAADFVKVCQEDGHERTMPGEFDTLADAIADLCKPGEMRLPTEDEAIEGPAG